MTDIVFLLRVMSASDNSLFLSHLGCRGCMGPQRWAKITDESPEWLQFSVFPSLNRNCEPFSHTPIYPFCLLRSNQMNQPQHLVGRQCTQPWRWWQTHIFHWTRLIIFASIITFLKMLLSKANTYIAIVYSIQFILVHREIE